MGHLVSVFNRKKALVIFKQLNSNKFTKITKGGKNIVYLKSENYFRALFYNFYVY